MDPEKNVLEQNRIEKLKRLQAAGIEAYPTRADVSHSSVDAIAEFEAREKATPEGSEVEKGIVKLAGRLRSMRPMGKITFAHIEDGSGRIQLFFRINDVGQEKMELFAREFDLGDFIQVSGYLFRTKTGEITLHVEDFSMLAKSITPLPAAKDEIVDGVSRAPCHSE